MAEFALPRGFTTLVDDVDASRMRVLGRWRVNGRGYVVRTWQSRGKNYSLSLHRFILGLEDPTRMVDHINGDKLDNRRENLRVVTAAGNAQNRRTRAASGRRGVFFNKKTRKWQAGGWTGGRYHYLGLHDSIDDAASVAAAFRAEHMPYVVEGR